jgi:hypothetical protein
MEINVERIKVMRISRQLFAMQILADLKQPDSVGEYFSHLGNI